MIKTAAGLVTKRFSVPTGGNAWAVSSDGRWAIAWTDAARAVSKSSADGFQDLTVIDLASGTSTALSVGYRPVAIGYDKGATRAFAITQDGISVIDLAAGLVTKNVSLSASVPPPPGTGGTGGSAEGGSGGSDSAGSSGAAGQGDAGTSNGGSAGNGGTSGK